MPKKLWGSPASGRIIVLEKNGLTIKEGGIIKKGNFFPYSSITNVSVDCPLVGFGTITFYQGYRKIEAYGFTRGQAKEVQEVVNAGYYDDSNDNNDRETETSPSTPNVSEPKPKDSFQQKKDEEATMLNAKTNEVLNIEVDPTNEDSMVKSLSALVTILETNEGDNMGNDSDELTKLRKASMSKFSAQLSMLRLAFPDNKLLPYFTAKEEAFIALEKKKKRGTFIILGCLLGVIALMFILGAILA